MDRKINISLTDVANKSFPFESLRVFYEFLLQERDFWKAQADRITPNQTPTHPFLNFHNNFTAAINIIDGWHEQLSTWTDAEFNQHYQNLQQQQLTHLHGHWLWSGNPAIEAFVQCHINYGHIAAEAFEKLVIRNSMPHPNNLAQKDTFMGVISAYEFLNQESDIVKRRNGEKVSLGHLRSQLAEAKDNLFTEVEEFKSDYIQWDQDARETTEKLYRVNKKLGNRQIKRQNKQFDENLRTWSETIDELEKTYKEKLRLDGPAKYWNKAAKRFSIQGGLWSLALVALVVVGLLYFREFFLAWLRGQELGIKLHTVQGLILFSAIAAVYAYLIRVLSRLAFSAFHLMRDAEEREQLTHLYLALSKETEVDEKSREIVLQALFSRSETGLLAQEHGPTMPGATEAIRSVLRAGGSK